MKLTSRLTCRVSCSTEKLLCTLVEPEPEPSDEPPFRYAFLMSTSVVFMQLGIGL